jgi:hypothetical protein
MTPEERSEKRARDRATAFKERTERQFPEFEDTFTLARARARQSARKRAARDSERYCSRPWEDLVASSFKSRIATQIFKNGARWLPEDCGQWLEELGVSRDDIEWILLEVSKKRARAIRAAGGIAIAGAGRPRKRAREWEE